MRILPLRMSPALFLYCLFCAAGLLAACGAPCDEARRCAVAGAAGQLEVCNGDDFVSCDEGSRGTIIFCENQPRKAVCGPGGWSFEYAPLPAP